MSSLTKKYGALVCGLVAGCTAAAPLSAQIQFSRPTRPVNVAQYATIEECTALMARLQASAERLDPLSPNIDTFPITVAERARRTPWPASLVQAATTCAARFTPDQVPLSDFDAFMPLFLQANRDADAERLATRLLATQAPFNGSESDRARVGTLYGILRRFYATARPARYAASARLLARELEAPTIGTYPRVVLLTLAAETADQQDDTVHAVQWTNLALTEFQRLAAQSQRGLDENQLHFLKDVLGKRTRHVMLDSLRSGVPAYVALRRTDDRFKEWVEQPPSPTARIGDRAAPLRGEFWFAAGSDTGNSGLSQLVRPSPGKTSLIVFLSPECRRREEDRSPVNEVGSAQIGCFGTYAMLKRLAHRFPKLELTIAAQTTGSVWPAGPMEPAAEAKYFRQWWLDFHQLPATLVVSATPFRRLDPPDRRRINGENPNATAYKTKTMDAVLVHRDGTIIERFSATREEEPWLTELLTILESENP